MQINQKESFENNKTNISRFKTLIKEIFQQTNTLYFVRQKDVRNLCACVCL